MERNDDEVDDRSDDENVDDRDYNDDRDDRDTVKTLMIATTVAVYDRDVEEAIITTNDTDDHRTAVRWQG